MSRTRVPVAVLGGGPVGLTASILLSRLGVEHVVLERHPDPAGDEPALVFGPRTLDVFAHIGLGELVRRCGVWRDPARPALELEPVLLAAALTYRQADLRDEATVIAMSDPDSPCPVTVSYETGDGARCSVTADYVIAAAPGAARVPGSGDGARVGRVFLVGDAAGPASGGPGLNTGVRDVYHLAWRIAAAVVEPDLSGLLDAYEAERGAPAGDPLPHAWLDTPDGRLSTLDLAAPGRWLLIVDESSAVWRDALGAAPGPLAAEIDIVEVGPAPGRFGRSGDDWLRLRQVGPAGALLVRPDAVVAWRWVDSPGDPATGFAAVLDDLAGIDGPAAMMAG